MGSIQARKKFYKIFNQEMKRIFETKKKYFASSSKKRIPNTGMPVILKHQKSWLILKYWNAGHTKTSKKLVNT
jgi:hypothetical protein